MAAPTHYQPSHSVNSSNISSPSDAAVECRNVGPNTDDEIDSFSQLHEDFKTLLFQVSKLENFKAFIAQGQSDQRADKWGITKKLGKCYFLMGKLESKLKRSDNFDITQFDDIQKKLNDLNTWFSIMSLLGKDAKNQSNGTQSSQSVHSRDSADGDIIDSSSDDFEIELFHIPIIPTKISKSLQDEQRRNLMRLEALSRTSASNSPNYARKDTRNKRETCVPPNNNQSDEKSPGQHSIVSAKTDSE